MYMNLANMQSDLKHKKEVQQTDSVIMSTFII